MPDGGLTLHVRMMQQRKSRRLVARAVKEADAQGPGDDHALSVDGTGAAFLLQRCSDSELALITSQVRHMIIVF